jgi:hypothetical protein
MDVSRASKSHLSRFSRQQIDQSSNSHYKNRFFESPPTAGFQKTDLGVSSAFIPVTPKYKNCCVTGMKIVKHSLMHD